MKKVLLFFINYAFNSDQQCKRSSFISNDEIA